MGVTVDSLSAILLSIFWALTGLLEAAGKLLLALPWLTEACAVLQAVDRSLSAATGVILRRNWPRTDDTDLGAPSLPAGGLGEVHTLGEHDDVDTWAVTGVMLSRLLGWLVISCCASTGEDDGVMLTLRIGGLAEEKREDMPEEDELYMRSPLLKVVGRLLGKFSEGRSKLLSLKRWPE